MDQGPLGSKWEKCLMKIDVLHSKSTVSEPTHGKLGSYRGTFRTLKSPIFIFLNSIQLFRFQTLPQGQKSKFQKNNFVPPLEQCAWTYISCLSRTSIVSFTSGQYRHLKPSPDTIVAAGDMELPIKIVIQLSNI